MSFAVRRVQCDGDTVVKVSGEIDIETAPKLRAALRTAVDEGRPVVVDLGEVEFMDSAGFGVLVAVRQRAAAAGTEVRLRGVSARISQLLAILGLDAVFPVDPPSPCLTAR